MNIRSNTNKTSVTETELLHRKMARGLHNRIKETL